MSVLFGKRRRMESKQTTEKKTIDSSSSHNSPILREKKHDKEEDNVLATKVHVDSSIGPSPLISFLNLGLDPWIVKKCELVGIRHPTPVQANCIPPILQGRDVLGCAQTGSGKTAAFALPILHMLSKDPYGPFALVLTPTRELAFQIADQFNVFGSSMGVRCAVVVGGVDMLKQALELQERPHIIIATPGRLHDHLLRPNPPNLALIKFLVLDEADRLLDASFVKDLTFIINKLPSQRQTLLFSATMTANLDRLEEMTLVNTYRFDATSSIKTVTTLKQYYLFIPTQVKMVYMMYLMNLLNPSNKEEDEEPKKRNHKAKKNKMISSAPTSQRPKTSIMIFVATCKMCELVGEIGNELGAKCVTLHSMMSQSRRLAALGKFKSGISRVLISTDVASRGLDIPEVDSVINFDLPRDADDYIHRVGRTARAGRKGQSISIVTQHDISLLQNIEEKIGKKMDDFESQASEKNVLKMLTEVTTATRVAKNRLTERGFDDKAQSRKDKRMEQRAKKLKTTQ